MFLNLFFKKIVTLTTLWPGSLYKSKKAVVTIFVAVILEAPLISYPITATFSGTSQFFSGSASKTVDLIQVASVELSLANYSVNEGSGTAQITVTRTDTSAAATVDYATSDTAGLTECNVFNGTASSRCDYATSIGTLRFAAGEASKTIFIPIVDDSYAEGDETFSITLSNPTGTILGPNTSATITIVDTRRSTLRTRLMASISSFVSSTSTSWDVNLTRQVWPAGAMC